MYQVSDEVVRVYKIAEVIMFIPLADLDEVLPVIEGKPLAEHVPLLIGTIKLLKSMVEEGLPGLSEPECKSCVDNEDYGREGENS